MAASPRITHATVTDTGGAVTLSGSVEHLQIANDQAIAVRLYFTLADFTGDLNYIELAASTGYYEGPDGISTIWLRLVSAGSQVVVVKYNSQLATVGL